MEAILPSQKLIIFTGEISDMLYLSKGVPLGEESPGEARYSKICSGWETY